MLRKQGQRKVAGGTGRREDFTSTKSPDSPSASAPSVAGVRRWPSWLRIVETCIAYAFSDEARHVLLDLYARSLVDGDRADRKVMLAGTGFSCTSGRPRVETA